MSIVPVRKVGEVPIEMFVEIRDTMADFGINPEADISFRWQEGAQTEEFHKILTETVTPILDIIDQREKGNVGFVEFSVRNALVQPGQSAYHDLGYHRDGRVGDSHTTYITADNLYTKFMFPTPKPQPGDVLRFRLAEHRSPQNKKPRQMFLEL